MNGILRSFFILSISFLSGCVIFPKAEKWQDPLAGMNLKDDSNSPKILASYKNKQVPILISQNTKGYVKTKKEVLSFFVWRSMGANQVKYAADPKITANAFMAILKNRLPNEYYITRDLDSGNASNFAVIIDRWADYKNSDFGGPLLAIKDQADMYFIDPGTRTLFWHGAAKADIDCVQAHNAGLLQVSGSVRFSPSSQDELLAKCFAYNESLLFNKIESDLMAALPSPSVDAPNKGPGGNEKYQELIEKGSDAQLYSVAMGLEQAGNVPMANKLYQAIVLRFPQSPYAAKAIEHQEKLTQAK